MLVGIGDEDVDYVAGIGVWAELRLRLCEVGVGHIVDRGFGELPGFVELVDDLGFVGGGSLEILQVDARGRSGSHQSQDSVAFTGDV
jgi:hypothetical protein